MHVHWSWSRVKKSQSLGLPSAVHTASPCTLAFLLPRNFDSQSVWPARAQNQPHSTVILGALLPPRARFQIPVKRLFSVQFILSKLGSQALCPPVQSSQWGWGRVPRSRTQPPKQQVVGQGGWPWRRGTKRGSHLKGAALLIRTYSSNPASSLRRGGNWETAWSTGDPMSETETRPLGTGQNSSTPALTPNSLTTPVNNFSSRHSDLQQQFYSFSPFLRPRD